MSQTDDERYVMHQRSDCSRTWFHDGPCAPAAMWAEPEVAAMTDTTAPRTAAGLQLRADLFPVDRDRSITQAEFSRRLADVEREAIEPLLALVRALTSISPFDYEQGLCYWCGGGWEDVTGPRGGKRPPEHTGLHKDECPFLRAALLANAPGVGQ